MDVQFAGLNVHKVNVSTDIKIEQAFNHIKANLKIWERGPAANVEKESAKKVPGPTTKQQ